MNSAAHTGFGDGAASGASKSMFSAGFLTVSAFLVALVSSIVLFQTQAQYLAQSSIMLERDSKASSAKKPGEFRPLGQKLLRQQLTIIKSEDVAKRALRGLDLSQDAGFQMQAGRAGVGFLSAIFGLQPTTVALSRQERALNWYFDRLVVSVDEPANRVMVGFTSSSPRFAAVTANAVVDGFRRLQADIKAGQNPEKVAELEQNLNAQRLKALNADASVVSFQQSAGQNKGGPPNPQTDLTLDALKEAAKKQSDLLNAALERFKAAKAVQGRPRVAIKTTIVSTAKPSMDMVWPRQSVLALCGLAAALIMALWAIKLWRSGIFRANAAIAASHAKAGSSTADWSQQSSADRLPAVQNTPAISTPELPLHPPQPEARETTIAPKHADMIAPVQNNVVKPNPIQMQSQPKSAHPTTPGFDLQSDAVLTLPISQQAAPQFTPISDIPVQNSAPVQAKVPTHSRVHHSLPGETELMTVARALALLDSARLVFATVPGESVSGGAVAIARLMASVGPTVLVDMAGDAFATNNMLGTLTYPGMKDILARAKRLDETLHNDRISGAHIMPIGNPDAQLTAVSAKLIPFILKKLQASYQFVVIDAGHVTRSGLGRIADEKTGIVINKPAKAHNAALGELAYMVKDSGYKEPVVLTINAHSANAVGVID